MDRRRSIYKNLTSLDRFLQKYSLIEIDSTFCKAHQNAAGALKKYGNQIIGVSSSGKNTKIHALVNEKFQLINVILTGGDVHDNECAISLLSAVKIERVS